jgi:diguanylate cyclase (GGDEF)-like protein/PAS domain S-box-containing protein
VASLFGHPFSRAGAALHSALGALPRGKSLPPDVWARRHRVLTALVWAHAVVLPIFALTQGLPLWHALLEGFPIAVFAAAAMVPFRSQRFRSSMVALGLLTSSAVLVHIWGGVIEAHFHFFVMVTILACYEAWFPYLLAVGYVVLHHGVMSSVAAGTVYNHGDAVANPWKWAAIHGGFVVAMCAANVVSWRLNEDVRDQMRASEEQFRTAFESAPIGMTIVAANGFFLRVNDAFCDTTGYTAEQLLGMKASDLSPVDERERLDREWAVYRGAGNAEHSFTRADGTSGWALWQRSVVADGNYLLQCVDMSDRQAAQQQLEKQARSDGLTGLPNRTRFAELLKDTLSARGENAVAVMFLDLDDFKVINDSLGHGSGDRLITQTARRLERVLRPGDTFARFGGDEFVMCLVDIADEDHAMRIAGRLIDALKPPFVLDGERRYVTASIGIALTHDSDASPDDLLRDADAAMYRAKASGKARCEMFDGSMRKQAVERLELETHLRSALERDEFRLLYQPKVELGSERIVGVEALIRWEHPEHGTIPPLKFIPLAEQSGLIVPIGAWVVQEACREAARWHAEFDRRDLMIAVNLSPRQLGTGGIVETVREALDETGLDPSALCLEVTESALMADIDTARETLDALKALGVRLAVDDFGVGHASLKQLKQLLPVDILKIDKSFVDGVVTDVEDRAIIEAVILLAGSLGLETIAEGVEHAAQADMLHELQCQLAQGYHFSRPVTPDVVAALLANVASPDLGEMPSPAPDAQTF